MNLRSTFLALGALLPALCFAQGALTPPGAPAPTMKSLAELDASLTAIGARSESRLALNATNTPGDVNHLAIISQPGSYYLASNLVCTTERVAVLVTAPDVTLDLNGFAILNDEKRDAAVACTSTGNFRIRNGSIRGPWSRAIDCSAPGFVAQDLQITGALTIGILVSAPVALAENCQVTDIYDGSGIRLHASESIARRCQVRNINSNTTEPAYGIQAGLVSECVASVLSLMGGAPTSAGLEGSVVVDSQVHQLQTDASYALGIAGGNITRCGTWNSFYTGTGVFHGIFARTANQCSVTGLNGSGNGTIFALKAGVAESCTVETINHQGGGLAHGIRGALVADSTDGNSSEETAIVRNCTVGGVKNTGIQVVGRGLVTGNRVGACFAGIWMSNGIATGNTTNNCTQGLSISGAGVATGNVSLGDATAFSFSPGVRAGSTLVGGGGGAFDPNANFDL
jgi:hypothetical protein